MVEMIVSVTVLITLTTSTLIGVSAAQQARVKLDRQALAENIARNQMEFIFSLDYLTSTGLYSTTNLWPSEFQVTATSTVETQTTSTDLQRIRVRILLEGEELLQLDTFRFNDGIDDN